MKTHDSTTPNSAPMRGSWILVLALTFVAYARTLSFSFVYDDVFHLFGDPRLSNWASVPGFFTEHLWSPLFDDGSYYRPIILLWFLVQKMSFGSNAMLWHLASVALHLFATLLVLRIAHRLLKDGFSSAVAALVFGLHPVHIESVAWISGSVDPLTAVFALAAYLGFFRWNDAPASNRGAGWRWMSVSLLCYALAQLTKETAIVVPGIIFFTALLIHPRPSASCLGKLKYAMLATLPYAVCAGLYFLIRWRVLGGILGNTGEAPPVELLLTLPGVLLQYAIHLAYPFGLSPVYETPYVTSFSWSSVAAPFGMLLIAGAGLACWSRRSAVVPVAVVWMVLPLLPVLNLALLPEPDRFHDRFLYLPSVGFALLAGLVISSIRAGGPRALGAPAAKLGAAILICAPLAIGTAVQSGHWKDDLHLFRRATAVAPGNNTGRNNLGKELIKAGQLEEAEGHLQTVIARAPDHTNALLNLGRIHFLRGELEASEQYLRRALESSPGNPDIHIELGFVHARMGRLDEAEQDFRNARALGRNRPGYGNPLGVLLRSQGRLSQALAVFEAELALDPGQEDVRQEVEKLRARIDAK